MPEKTTYEVVRKGSAKRDSLTDKIIEGSEETYLITSCEAQGEEMIRVECALGVIMFPYQDFKVDLENDEFFVRESVASDSETTEESSDTTQG